MRLLYIALLLSALSFGQDRNGISYQALILNPQGEQLPGQDNDHAPLTNTDICLQFHIINSSGNYEYSESQSVRTDAYGIVNLVIGTGTPIGAITWGAVAWSAEAKSLKVDLDLTGACTSFTELSNQQLTSVPFALYSPASNVPGPKGDPGDPGEDGDSAYQVWLDEGNTATEQEFLDSLKGTDGEPGDPGADGDSAYQVWIDEGNTGTEQEFLDSLKGTDGKPAYELRKYPNTINLNEVSLISQSDLENYDLFYVDCNRSATEAPCLLELSDISIQGKVVKIIENLQSYSIILEFSTGLQIKLNTSNVFGFGITDRGPFFETLTLMWDEAGGKWDLFR